MSWPIPARNATASATSPRVSLRTSVERSVPDEQMTQILRIREEMSPKPDPYAVLNGGLRGGDEVRVSWFTPTGLQMSGSRLEVYRDGVRLKWQPSGLCRDVSGGHVYAPFLTNVFWVREFVSTLATSCGYVASVIAISDATFGRYKLEEKHPTSQRIVSGDRLVFSHEEKSFQLIREQGMLDAILPMSEDGCVATLKAECVSASHHPHVIARILTEANGLRCKQDSKDSFLVIP